MIYKIYQVFKGRIIRWILTFWHIILQDPVVFCGTLRTNLDPFDTYMDPDLWRALEHAHLKDFVEDLPEGLDFMCSEGGDNLRYLYCTVKPVFRGHLNIPVKCPFITGSVWENIPWTQECPLIPWGQVLLYWIQYGYSEACPQGTML